MNNVNSKRVGSALRRTPSWLKLAAGGLLVLLLLLLVFYALFMPVRVASDSMAPTLVANDWVMARRYSLTPQRGDVVVFHYNQFGNQEVLFIKRVIGLPGERIVIEGGQITIYNQQHPNGFELKLEVDSSLSPFPSDEPRLERTIAADEIFVIGDNRQKNASIDSRDLPFGNISIEAIRGIVLFKP